MMPELRLCEKKNQHKTKQNQQQNNTQPKHPNPHILEDSQQNCESWQP